MRLISNPLLALLILAMGVSSTSCFKKNPKEQKPIARVFDKFLYKNDIDDIFPQGITRADSVQILNAYVDQWIRHQLVLRRAESNLTEEQKDVAKQLEDYRSSLLIFKYEQEFIKQKLDTSVTEQELSNFYYSNTSNFVLGETLVKALYIKLRKDSQYMNRIKELYRSTKDDDVKALDNMAYQVALKYDYFGDKWISLSLIQRELPYPIENPDEYLRRNRTIEMEDGEFAYLVSIRSVMFKGETSPFEHERENIKSIVINMRKQKLIADLNNRIYNEAQNHNQFEKFK
jgi:hypothetical protein